MWIWRFAILNSPVQVTDRIETRIMYFDLVQFALYSEVLRSNSELFVQSLGREHFPTPDIVPVDFVLTKQQI